MTLEQLKQLADALTLATGLLQNARQDESDFYTRLLEMLDEVELQITIVGSQG